MYCAHQPPAVLFRVRSVTTTSLFKEFIRTIAATLTLPASSWTEYVPFNPIVTAKVGKRR